MQHLLLDILSIDTSKNHKNNIKCWCKTNKKSLKAITHDLESKLTLISQTAKKLADEKIVVSGQEKILETKLKEIIKNNIAIHSISVAYAPYTYNPSEKNYSVQFVRQGDHLKKDSIEKFYDYRKKFWYTSSKTSDAQWFEPYFESSVNTIITRYSHPLFRFDKEKQQQVYIGVLNIDISIDYLNEIIASFGTSKDSYAMMAARNGILLAHPSEEYIAKNKSIFDLAQSPGKKDFILLGNAITKQATGSITMHDTLHEKTYTALYKAVPNTEWILIIIAPEKLNLVSSTLIRRTMTNLLLSLILFLSLFVSLISGLHRGTNRGIWLSSIATSIFLACGVGGLWALDIFSTEKTEFHQNIINNEIMLDHFIYVHKHLNPQLYKTKTHFIPTGLFMYSIDLKPTKQNISINGHIWQKYNLKEDKDLSRGLTIFNANEQSFEKVYEHIEEDIQTIGWRFHATIKENFDYTKYPFDQQNIVLILGHKDYKANSILTPDFEAFSATNDQFPEIDPIARITQWKTKNTYSFYQLTDYVTDFGIEDYTHQKNFPNLSFNISVRRNFIDPLIASFLPISIILMIVFSILLVTGFDRKRSNVPTLVLRLSSGIFFATAVAHRTFRSMLQSPSITYFEYFYFVLYAIILLTTMNGMLYGYSRGGWFITYCKNLIPRLLYWPVILSLFLGNTLLFFY